MQSRIIIIITIIIITIIIIRKYHNSLLKTVFLYLIPCVLAGGG